MSQEGAREKARFYDHLWATQWRAVAQHSPLRSMRERLVLAQLASHLTSARRVLDVGSGDGHLLEMLRERHPRIEVRGMDISAAARDTAPASLRPLIEVGDVQDVAVTFSGEVFDLIVCSEVLEHVSDPLRVMKGVKQLLAPHGVVVFTVPGSMRYWSGLDCAAGHLRRFEYDAFRELVERAGLRAIKHFGWGSTVGRLYYRLVRTIGPSRAAASAASPLGALAGRVISTMLRVDDLLPTRNGFQLVTVAAHG